MILQTEHPPNFILKFTEPFLLLKKIQSFFDSFTTTKNNNLLLVAVIFFAAVIFFLSSTTSLKTCLVERWGIGEIYITCWNHISSPFPTSPTSPFFSFWISDRSAISFSNLQVIEIKETTAFSWLLRLLGNRIPWSYLEWSVVTISWSRICWGKDFWWWIWRSLGKEHVEGSFRKTSLSSFLLYIMY